MNMKFTQQFDDITQFGLLGMVHGMITTKNLLLESHNDQGCSLHVHCISKLDEECMLESLLEVFKQEPLRSACLLVASMS